MKMKIERSLVGLLAACLFLSGCTGDTTNPVDIKPEDRGPDVEPTATYDWMAGESPVPTNRIGVERYGVNNSTSAVSPSGTYFLAGERAESSYIYYADHGSDNVVLLCGRVDCTHENEDCNAWVYVGEHLCYYHGYLYVVSGNDSEQTCKLIRMEPDGSDRVTVIDALAFAKEKGGDLVRISAILDGYVIISVFGWAESTNGTSNMKVQTSMGAYLYKLDGSMDEPMPYEMGVATLYYCGDTLTCRYPDPETDIVNGALASGDLSTQTATYLIEHPGWAGYYDDTAGYYHQNGKIIRLDYATQTEETLVETGLEGKYSLLMFPDCMIVVSSDRSDTSDKKLYFYNWSYELVDTIELTVEVKISPNYCIVGETAERIFISIKHNELPLVYIDKAELGTGELQFHELIYPE